MDFRDTTVGTLLRKQAALYGDRPYIIYSDRNFRFTYREFDERVDALAKGILAIGLSKGDHLGWWANNIPDWNTFLFATARIGVVYPGGCKHVSKGN